MSPTSIELQWYRGNKTGRAIVEFSSLEQAQSALKKTNFYIVFRSTKSLFLKQLPVLFSGQEYSGTTNPEFHIPGQMPPEIGTLLSFCVRVADHKFPRCSETSRRIPKPINANMMNGRRGEKFFTLLQSRYLPQSQ